MDKHVQHIVEDLLPLYQEGLVSDETKKWLEAQLHANPELRRLADALDEPFEKEKIPEIPEASQEEMFKKINRKLTMYQFFFVAISLILAFQTTIWNDSFGFILSYAVLGFVIYLFYTDLKIVFLFSFVPIFIWSVIEGVMSVERTDEISNFTFGFEIFQMALLISVIHFLFALVGSLIGWIVKKLREKKEVF